MATTTPDDVLKLIKDKEVKFVDLRFTDTRGKEQHVTVPVKYFGKDKFEQGHAFDGSSIAGWKGIQASDMLLMPDAVSARMDPFTDEPVMFICRSGARSHSAAEAAMRAGWQETYNVLEGFEGDKDDQKHRNTVGGWRKTGLPWTQS